MSLLPLTTSHGPLSQQRSPMAVTLRTGETDVDLHLHPCLSLPPPLPLAPPHPPQRPPSPHPPPPSSLHSPRRWTEAEMTDPVSLTRVHLLTHNRPLSTTSWFYLLGEGLLSNSGYFEGFCSSRRASTCSQHSLSPQITDDLPELLRQLGLIKYIDIFEQQEVIINSLSVQLC